MDSDVKAEMEKIVLKMLGKKESEYQREKEIRENQQIEQNKFIFQAQIEAWKETGSLTDDVSNAMLGYIEKNYGEDYIKHPDSLKKAFIHAKKQTAKAKPTISKDKKKLSNSIGKTGSASSDKPKTKQKFQNPADALFSEDKEFHFK